MREHRSRSSLLALALLIGAAGVSSSRPSTVVDAERIDAASFRDLLDIAPAVPAEQLAPRSTVGVRSSGERSDGLGAVGPARLCPAGVQAAAEVRRPAGRAHRSGRLGTGLLGLAASPANAPPHGS